MLIGNPPDNTEPLQPEARPFVTFVDLCLILGVLYVIAVGCGLVWASGLMEVVLGPDLSLQLCLAAYALLLPWLMLPWLVWYYLRSILRAARQRI